MQQKLPSNITREDLDKHGHPRIPRRGHYTRAACNDRLEWLEKFTGASLNEIGNWWAGEGTDPARSTEILKSNIENPIGVIKVPVAAAGPLLFEGENANGYIVCPLATTEGALVASVTRGATALNQAGGVKVYCTRQRMVRAPLWHLSTPAHLPRLESLISTTIGLSTLRAEITKHSSHAKLLHLTFHTVNTSTLHVRFVYETGDAAGQNMTTTCTWEACRLINETIDAQNKLHLAQTGQPFISVTQFIIDGNLSSDKKLSQLNIDSGRGIQAVAESVIPAHALLDTLKVDPKLFVEGFKHIRDATHQVVGTHGFSLNCANVIAGVFGACGQDLASVYESSAANLEMEWVEPCEAFPEGGAKCKMTLHCLVIGTVGGGTGLPTQRECLEMMGCYGRGKVRRLAEVIVGYAMALDISTLAALVSHQFAKAHERLGRNRPDLGFTIKDLTPEFWKECLVGAGIEGEFGGWAFKSLDSSESILSDIAAGNIKNKMVGLYGATVTTTTTTSSSLDVVLKVKTTDVEVNNALNKMAFNVGGRVKDAYEAVKTKTGFRACHLRELILAGTVLKDSPFTPKVYNVVREESKDAYVLVMEHLDDTPGSGNVMFLKTANEGSLVWKEEHINIVLRDIATFHSQFLHTPNFTTNLQKLEPVREYLEILTPKRAQELQSLHQALLEHALTESPHLFDPPTIRLLQSCIQNSPKIIQTLRKPTHPQTLIHNDFSPRNLCLRKATPTSTSTSDLQMCLYDLELSTLGVPQRDLAEFLTFTLPTHTPLSVWETYILRHRAHLQSQTQVKLPGVREYVDAFDLAMCEFLGGRWLMYGLAHTFKSYGFYERVFKVGIGYLKARLEVSKVLRGVLGLEGGVVGNARL
ncbi:hypothetical protein HDV05_008720 [Chytridiales sp. JEL 0842]|nr:hypothetical protein HDV05_008720 [Chytridiales sp. JEL 0842]